MKYVSPATYSREQKSFKFRKGESGKRKQARQATRSFLKCFSSHPEIGQGRNYYFLKALMEMPEEFYSEGFFSEKDVAKAVKSAAKRDDLRSFDYQNHLRWAVEARYVNEVFMISPDNGLEKELVTSRELDFGVDARFVGYSINQKNISMLLKYQGERVERLLGVHEEACRGFGRALMDVLVDVFKRR